MPIFEVRLSLPQPNSAFAFSARGMIDALDSWLRKQSVGWCCGHATDSLMIAQFSAPALDDFLELIDSYANKQRQRSPQLTVTGISRCSAPPCRPPSMVVYLDEAVQRKREVLGDSFGRGALITAVKEGARLRLRPKVMTVATIVASLLPIMWSHRTGSEVMQPLATPILGGMISSLLHILVVTPVLYVELHVRRLD